jgi:hypothetical protein
MPQNNLGSRLGSLMPQAPAAAPAAASAEGRDAARMDGGEMTRPKTTQPGASPMGISSLFGNDFQGSPFGQFLSGLLQKNAANKQQNQAAAGSSMFPKDFNLSSLLGSFQPHMSNPAFQNELMQLMNKFKIPLAGG